MTDFDPVEMDNAATEAEDELSNTTDPNLQPGIDFMTQWWYRWFITAGHKRLGRILVGHAKEMNLVKEG